MILRLTNLPTILVDIEQPGDKGDFHITVIDTQNQYKITQQRIKEDRSYLEYLYTGRLLDTGFIDRKTEDSQRLAKQRHDDLVRYGQALYRDLFGQDNTFRQYLAKQPHLQNGAHFVLGLHSTASELWNTPWEYMHDGNQFLGNQPQYPISRKLLDVQLNRDNLDLNTVPCPLRMLMVVSHPSNAMPLDIDTEIAMIRRAVKAAEDEGRIEIDYVEEGSLENLDKALLDGDYHILHFSGHGSVTPQGSCLVMEDAVGQASPVFLPQIIPLLKRSENLRFVFLNACKAGTITATKATSGIATGMLQVVPSVLAMQFSINDRSATILAEAFYGGLGKGHSIEEALHSARLALSTSSPRMGDWGVPALYAHQTNIRMLDTRVPIPAARPRQRFALDQLPTSDPFVGRHDEQRLMRSAIPNTAIHAIFIWGMSGMGKSALVRRILERSGERDLLEDVLVLRCDKLELTQIVSQISQWIARHFPKAAPILRDNRRSPVQRLQDITPLVRGKRVILVLDNINSAMEMQEDRHGEFPHPLLTDYFHALASASWSILTIFTSRLRWAKLTELASENCIEIHLTPLQFMDIHFLLQNLTHLKNVSEESISNFFKAVGGHPLTMHYVNQYLSENPQQDPLADPKLPKRLAAWWHQYFLAEMFRHLTPAARAALRLLSVHGEAFDPQYVQLLVKLPSLEDAERVMVSWELLSLAFFVETDENDKPLYIIPSLVRTYVIEQIKPEQLAGYHAEVARVMEHNFFLNALNRHEKVGGPQPDPKDEFQSVLKEVEVMPKRMIRGSEVRYLRSIYSWHHHLREAGDHSRANKVALAMLPSIWLLRDYTLAGDLVKLLLEKISKNSEDYATIRYWEATYAIETDNPQEASALLRSLEKTANEKKQTRLLVQIMMRRGEIARNTGSFMEANRLWRTAIDLAQRPMDVVMLIQLLFRLGELAYFHGQISEAVRSFDDAINMISKTDHTNVDLRTIANLNLYRGHLFRKSMHDFEAFGYYRDALNLAEQLQDGYLIGKSLESIGYTYGLLRQYDVAARYILQATDIFRNIDDKISLVLAQSRLAQIYGYKGNVREALVFCERAMELAVQYAPFAIEQTRNLQLQLKRQAES